MQILFLDILDMSITASIVIIAVLLVRILLKRVPKVYSYALWAVVLFRLLCPFTIESALSLIPEQVQQIPQEMALETTEHVTPLSAMDAAQRSLGDMVNGGIDYTIWVRLDYEDVGVQGVDYARPWQVWLIFFGFLWPVGIVGMLGYSIISYAKLRRKLIGAVPLEDADATALPPGKGVYSVQAKSHRRNKDRVICEMQGAKHKIYLADYIESPFVMGLICPKIYLPSTMAESEREYVILHEQHHIRRGDHIVKLLAFVALCIHWFNPLVWVAFSKAGKDMEMSCDEAVIKRMGQQIRAEYSASLLKLATGRHIFAGTPLAFGEGDTKGRIKNLAKWKQPRVWISVIAIIVCAIVAVVLVVDPKTEPDPAEVVGEYDVSELGGEFLKSGNPAYEVGVNAYGMPIFKDYEAAFHAMEEDYGEAIRFIQEQFDLPALTISNYGYEGYAIYGAQVMTDDEKLRADCMAVAQFLDLYENSFDYGSYIRVDWEPTKSGNPEATEVSTDGVYYGGKFLAQMGTLSFQPEDGSYYNKIVLEGEKLTVISNQREILYEGAIMTEESWRRDALIKKIEELGLFEPNLGHLKGELLENWIPEYAGLDMRACHYYKDEAKQEIAYTVYYFNGEPTWFVEGEYWRFYEIRPASAEIVVGASYVSHSCTYMNPASSILSNGDTGYRYLVSEDSFTLMHRRSGNETVISSVEWGWQAFPWTDEQWEELYVPGSLSEYKISQYYDEMLYQPLSKGYCLLSMDGELWLVNLRETPQNQPYIWSIFTLKPESLKKPVSDRLMNREIGFCRVI